MSNKYGLLIGNGLNNAEEFFDWKTLINDIRKNLLKIDKNHVTYEGPPTINFEVLITQLFRHKVYFELNTAFINTKIEIINRLNNISLNRDKDDVRIELFQSLNPDVVLTTNYDSLLQQAYIEANNFEGHGNWNNREHKYNLYRKYNINGIGFYHIHGCIAKPESIVLGYEHYAGSLEKMRKYINPLINFYITDEKEDNVNDGNIKNKAINFYNDNYETHEFKKDFKKIREYNLQNINIFGYNKNTLWMNHFFTKDLYILGLGLDYSEIDLWWLLVYRSYLINLTSRMNNIYYLDTMFVIDENTKKSKRDNYIKTNSNKTTKHNLLKGLDVNVLTFEIRNENDYKQAYKLMIRYIKDHTK